ncbi:PREDICTED: signal recognition particle 54 kDa protein 2 [Tarenaya hassleriana]|uniref:signal recognition particle 54 kDa protein 2 n=1 Tax=Tarenaya hassleriana TaxID=28532 RepID=UPI00053C8BD1|nr:PREDICTED: signal recognition particle 54 kDa protein 2 [Tarenaya hassleriana]
MNCYSFFLWFELWVIMQAIFDEMCVVLDWGKPTFIPTKGDPSIVLVVGLRGSGKTTTCVKYARYHREMGYSPALVCADTFRAYKQLKQSAWSAGVPCYGSYIDWDPARIARQEIEWCRKDGHDLIIVDTSGRHEQEGALFEGMRRLVEATKPHLVILVVDSRIGQTALDQAAAFKRNLGVRRGAVILTHLDGHPKGVGALSA